jgi:hypothetical protein
VTTIEKAALEWLPISGADPIDLNSYASGFLLTDPPEGLTVPPVRITSTAIFDQSGESVDNVQFAPRPVDLPIAMLADSEPAVSGLQAFLARAMDPTPGFGRLRLTRIDGVARTLPCLYSKGLEGKLLVGEAPIGDLWAQTTVELVAYDPFWTDAEDTVLTFHTAGSAKWFGHAWFPITLAGSSVFADLTITNAGDGLAWPVFTLTGPMTNPVLTNLTTGKTIDLTGGVTLADGDVLTIDTRPGVGLIRKVAADHTTITNEWPALTNASDLWPLVTGDNHVTLTAGGATTASSIQIAYRLRWLSY